MQNALVLSFRLAFVICVLSTLFALQTANAQQEAKINDAAKVLSRVDLERISFALQDLQEKAMIEGSVQFLNNIEQEYPRPVTSRDLALLFMIPSKQIRITVGSELKTLFPESRVEGFKQELMTGSVQDGNYADAAVDVLKRFTEVGRSEGGIGDAEKAENGKALALVIAICSATVLMGLWMVLFMNKFVGEKVSLAPYRSRIVGAHLAALIGLVGAYVLEVQLALGLLGMLIIPVVFVIQAALLYKVFKTLLPAVGRG